MSGNDTNLSEICQEHNATFALIRGFSICLWWFGDVYNTGSVEDLREYPESYRFEGILNMYVKWMTSKQNQTWIITIFLRMIRYIIQFYHREWPLWTLFTWTITHIWLSHHNIPSEILSCCYTLWSTKFRLYI